MSSLNSWGMICIDFDLLLRKWIQWRMEYNWSLERAAHWMHRLYSNIESITRHATLLWGHLKGWGGVETGNPIINSKDYQFFYWKFVFVWTQIFNWEHFWIHGCSKRKRVETGKKDEDSDGVDCKWRTNLSQLQCLIIHWLRDSMRPFWATQTSATLTSVYVWLLIFKIQLIQNGALWVIIRVQLMRRRPKLGIVS